MPARNPPCSSAPRISQERAPCRLPGSGGDDRGKRHEIVDRDGEFPDRGGDAIQLPLRRLRLERSPRSAPGWPPRTREASRHDVVDQHPQLLPRYGPVPGELRQLAPGFGHDDERGDVREGRAQLFPEHSGDGRAPHAATTSFTAVWSDRAIWAKSRVTWHRARRVLGGPSQRALGLLHGRGEIADALQDLGRRMRLSWTRRKAPIAGLTRRRFDRRRKSSLTSATGGVRDLKRRTTSPRTGRSPAPAADRACRWRARRAHDGRDRLPALALIQRPPPPGRRSDRLELRSLIWPEPPAPGRGWPRIVARRSQLGRLRVSTSAARLRPYADRAASPPRSSRRVPDRSRGRATPRLRGGDLALAAQEEPLEGHLHRRVSLARSSEDVGVAEHDGRVAELADRGLLLGRQRAARQQAQRHRKCQGGTVEQRAAQIRARRPCRPPVHTGRPPRWRPAPGSRIDAV